MQAHEEQHAVGEAVKDESDTAQRDDHVAKALDGLPDWRPDDGCHDAHTHRRKRRNDWDKATTGEEAEVARQLHILVIVVGPRSNNTDNDTAEHAHLERGCVWGRIQDVADRTLLVDCIENQDTDRTAKGGNAGTLGETNGHTDCEQDWQCAEDGVSSECHDLPHRKKRCVCGETREALARVTTTEKYSEAKQQRRRRKHCDRKH